MDYPRTVRARAPLRLGLAGGGTDLSPYCDRYGGAVLNTTIGRYAYAFIEPSDDDRIHLVAPDIDLVEDFPTELETLCSARLCLHAGVMRRMLREFGAGRTPAVRVTSYVDAPPGSGLGSSSALVVALVEAFTAYLAAPLGPYDVAHLAYEIERLDLQLPGGKQDQYAATFGGTNFIEFHGSDRVIVNPLRIAPAVLNELEASMVVCFSGVSRRSEEIIREQQRRMATPGDTALESLHQLKSDALEMKDALLRGQIQRMAEVLNRSWQAKRRTATAVSSSRIEELYDVALGSGMSGGKVSGAGGGGFLMFIVPPNRRFQVVSALNAAGGSAGGVQLTANRAESWLA